MTQLLLGLEGASQARQLSRLYLALLPPPAVVPAIADIVSALHRRCGPGFRFYDPAVWHISLFRAWEGATLHDGQIAHVIAKVRQLRAPPVEVMFDVAGSLSGRTQDWPLVLMPSGNLVGVTRLAAAIGHCVAPARKLPHSALPHLTLGRGRRLPLERLPDAIRFRASHFALIASGGAPWAVHAEFPLDGADFPDLPVSEPPLTLDLFGPTCPPVAENPLGPHAPKPPGA